MRLIYHPDAETELIEAARFYEACVPQLGAQFLNAADKALSVLLDAPERWHIVEADVRRCAMRRFPYFIYYRVLPGQVRILAFAHHIRHPDYWRERLT